MPLVHIINPLENANGGSEWHATSLFDLLAPVADVCLWANGNFDRDFIGRYPVRRIQSGDFPKGGNLVFVGVYQGIGSWIHASNPRRIILIYNFVQPERLELAVKSLASVQGLPPVEISFVSDYLRRMTPGFEGPVNNSPLDLDRFSNLARSGQSFTIGRVSRDEPEKHHPDDLALYRRLAAQECRVRILGGTCLADERSRGELSEQGIELLPTGAEAVEVFLQSLDVFYYRTDPGYKEAWGRVVLEAMASGLPIVAGPHGGYADAIVQEETGFIIDSAEQAQEVILRLRNDSRLREFVGSQGQAAAKELYSQESLSRIAEYYRS